MTLTLEQTTIGAYTIAWQWDKHQGHQLFIGELFNGLLHTDSLRIYGDKFAAKRAYKRAIKNFTK